MKEKVKTRHQGERLWQTKKTQTQRNTEVSSQRGRADEKLGAQLILNYLKNIKENPSLETPESMVLTKFLMSNGSKKKKSKHSAAKWELMSFLTTKASTLSQNR